MGGWVGVPLKALFLVSIISNTEINIYFYVYKLKGGLPYNTDCFSYWQGTIQASYAVMQQLLFFYFSFLPIKYKCIHSIFHLYHMNISMMISLSFSDT